MLTIPSRQQLVQHTKPSFLPPWWPPQQEVQRWASSWHGCWSSTNGTALQEAEPCLGLGPWDPLALLHAVHEAPYFKSGPLEPFQCSLRGNSNQQENKALLISNLLLGQSHTFYKIIHNQSSEQKANPDCLFHPSAAHRTSQTMNNCDYFSLSKCGIP